MLNKLFSFFKKGGAIIVPNNKFASVSDDAVGLDKQIRDKCNADGNSL